MKQLINRLLIKLLRFPCHKRMSDHFKCDGSDFVRLRLSWLYVVMRWRPINNPNNWCVSEVYNKTIIAAIKVVLLGFNVRPSLSFLFNYPLRRYKSVNCCYVGIVGPIGIIWVNKFPVNRTRFWNFSDASKSKWCFSCGNKHHESKVNWPVMQMGHECEHCMSLLSRIMSTIAAIYYNSVSISPR